MRINFDRWIAPKARFPQLRTRSIAGSISSALLLGLLLGYGAQKANAHGALVEVRSDAVEVNAVFEDGQPMANAQVVIYAPDNLQTPWAKGETDAAGQFRFEPDVENVGTWEVTVRQAGHGGTTAFEVGESGYASSSVSSVRSPMQKWGTIAAVIWGFVGTALFFSAKTSAKTSADTPTNNQAIDKTSAVNKTSTDASASAEHSVPSRARS